ncbi:hypothetical protein HMPREF2141_00637 [Bacteroides uniformis]|nr:hypothetical protein M093_2515 [Bacteroides uniformis str. 3978 T3 i]KXT38522.1 hypothetical protein HMPREF2141_00637 [Bacteroides uniformis]
MASHDLLVSEGKSNRNRTYSDSFSTVFFIFMRNIASEKQYMTYVCSISVSI